MYQKVGWSGKNRNEPYSILIIVDMQQNTANEKDKKTRYLVQTLLNTQKYTWDTIFVTKLCYESHQCSDIIPSVGSALEKYKKHIEIEVFFKGVFDTGVGCLDALSGSYDNKSNKVTRLDDRIEERIKFVNRKIKIRICGFALDECVKKTAIQLYDKLNKPIGKNVDIKIIVEASPVSNTNYRVERDSKITSRRLIHLKKNQRDRPAWIHSGRSRIPIDPDEGFPTRDFGKSRGGSQNMIALNAGLMLFLVTFFAALVPRRG